MAQEIKTLQEKLADYNKTVDHIRTELEMSEVKRMVRYFFVISHDITDVHKTSVLHEQNAHKKAQLETVFNERKACVLFVIMPVLFANRKEKMVQDERQLIEDMQQQAEQQINDLVSLIQSCSCSLSFRIPHYVRNTLNYARNINNYRKPCNFVNKSCLIWTSKSPKRRWYLLF